MRVEPTLELLPETSQLSRFLVKLLPAGIENYWITHIKGRERNVDFKHFPEAPAGM